MCTYLGMFCLQMVNANLLWSWKLVPYGSCWKLKPHRGKIICKLHHNNTFKCLQYYCHLSHSKSKHVLDIAPSRNTSLKKVKKIPGYRYVKFITITHLNFSQQIETCTIWLFPETIVLMK